MIVVPDLSNPKELCLQTRGREGERPTFTVAAVGLYDPSRGSRP